MEGFMTQRIRVLIAEDYNIVRAALGCLLRDQDWIEVVGETMDGIQTLAQATKLIPDVLLLDLILPGKMGIEIIRELKSQSLPTRILVLTGVDDDEMMFMAIKAGADGYLLKASPPDVLLKMIRSVYTNGLVLHPSIAHKFVRKFQRVAHLSPLAEELTHRERDVLVGVARGLSNDEIAAALHLSSRSIRAYLFRIQQKLRLSTRNDMTLFALRNGLVAWSEVDASTSLGLVNLEHAFA
jgi:DNA-binding NarL/FixJ family response regulator